MLMPPFRSRSEQTIDTSQFSPPPFRRYYFSEADLTWVAQFDIVLGNWGVSSWATQHLTERIQPVVLRAPEVLIEAP